MEKLDKGVLIWGGVTVTLLAVIRVFIKDGKHRLVLSTADGAKGLTFLLDRRAYDVLRCQLENPSRLIPAYRQLMEGRRDIARMTKVVIGAIAEVDPKVRVRFEKRVGTVFEMDMRFIPALVLAIYYGAEIFATPYAALEPLNESSIPSGADRGRLPSISDEEMRKFREWLGHVNPSDFGRPS